MEAVSTSRWGRGERRLFRHLIVGHAMGPPWGRQASADGPLARVAAWPPALASRVVRSFARGYNPRPTHHAPCQMAAGRGATRSRSMKSQHPMSPGEKSMYAVIKSGGKQYRVQEGQTLKLEKLEVPTGDTIEFDEVLLVGNDEDVTVGAPLVDGAKVSAEVVSHGRGDKVKIIKFRRRKHSMTRKGHRQWFTEVKITGISA